MSQAEAVDRRIGYGAKRLQQAVRIAGDNALRPYGLSMPQYAVLAVLTGRPGSSNSELARRCFVTRQTMNVLLAGLLAAGLVTRAAHPRDGRVQRVELTPAGVAAAEHGDAAMAEIEERMTADLTAADQQDLLELMDACVRNLGRSWPEEPT